MLSIDELAQIKSLKDMGFAKCKVSNQLNISYSTVNYWWNRELDIFTEPDKCPEYIRLISEPLTTIDTQYQSTYSYVLGIYLGDGYINLHNKKYQVFKFRIFQDSKYPNLINEHISSLGLLFKDCIPNVYLPHKNSNCRAITVYSKIIPILFPQWQGGRKDERLINLEHWQLSIIDKFPHHFIKGLIQSDGCRYIHRNNKYEYPKYNFTNSSTDIVTLFMRACNLIDVHPTVHTRPSRNFEGDISDKFKITVTVNKREDVAILDSFIGPKT